MRNEHLFQFKASEIAARANAEASYHRDRRLYWQTEYDIAVATVEKTVGAKVVRQPITDGYTVSVVVDYGDRAAYDRMTQAFSRIQSHRKAEEAYAIEYNLYLTQGDRVYELDTSDVQYFHIGDDSREQGD